MADSLGELIIKITGDTTDINKSIDSVRDKIEGSGQTFKKIGGMVSSFMTHPIVQFGIEAVKAAGEAERAEAKFANALKQTGKAATVSIENMKQFASQLQNVSLYEDDATIQAASLVEQFAALDEEGLKKTLPAVQDLAAALGMDLDSAATLVAKSIGSDTNALARYGIEVTKGATKSERLAQITDQLNAKFGGTAKAMAESGLGPLQQLQNTIGNLVETIGALILPAVKAVASFLNTAFTALQGYFDWVQKFWKAIGDFLNPIPQKIKLVYNEAYDLNKIFEKLSTAGVNLQKGFTPVIETIGNNIFSLGKTLKNILPDVFEGFKRSAEEMRQEIIDDSNAEIKAVQTMGNIFGNTLDTLTAKQSIFRNEINELVKTNLPENESRIKAIKKEYDNATNAINIYTSALTVNKEALKNVNTETAQQEINLSNIAANVTGKAVEASNNLSESLKKNEEDFKLLANTTQGILGPVFETLGTGLAGQLESWDQFGEAVKDAISKAISALGQYLFVQGLASIANPPLAALYFAGSAAASIAAGVVAALADGGLVMPTGGGQHVIMAEAGNPEFAIPDRKDVMSQIADRITQNMQRPINNIFTPNVSMPNNMVVRIGDKEFFGMLTTASRNGQFLVDQTRGFARK